MNGTWTNNYQQTVGLSFDNIFARFTGKLYIFNGTWANGYFFNQFDGRQQWFNVKDSTVIQLIFASTSFDHFQQISGKIQKLQIGLMDVDTEENASISLTDIIIEFLLNMSVNINQI